MDDVTYVTKALIFYLVGALLYFLPSFIEYKRKSASFWGVFILNLTLGWTFFGWLIAMLWVLNSIIKNKPGFKKCPYCAEEIREDAIKCRFCKENLSGLPPGQNPFIPEEVRKLISENRQVEIEYEDGEGEVTRRRIDVYVCNDQRFQCWDYLRNDVREFRFDRVLAWRPLDSYHYRQDVHDRIVAHYYGEENRQYNRGRGKHIFTDNE